MTEKKQKIFIIINESVVGSVVKDIVTFGMFGGLMYFNHKVLSGNGWIDAIFILIVVLYLQAKNLSTVFSGKREDAIKWLQEENL